MALIKQADSEQATLDRKKRETEHQFNKKRLAMLGLEEEESKASLHKQPLELSYPGRQLDEHSSVLQQTVRNKMVSL